VHLLEEIICTSVYINAEYQHRSRGRAARKEAQAGWVCMMEAGEGLFTSELSVSLNLPVSEPCLFLPYNLSFLPERRVTTKSKLNSRRCTTVGKHTYSHCPPFELSQVKTESKQHVTCRTASKRCMTNSKVRNPLMRSFKDAVSDVES
jgi:hypothetical protein